MHVDFGRKNIQVGVIDAAMTLALVYGRSMLENQRSDAPVCNRELLDGTQKLLQVWQPFVRQISEGRDMCASQEQQTALHELAQRRHDNEPVVFINDSGSQAISHQFSENTGAVTFQLNAKRTSV